LRALALATSAPDVLSGWSGGINRWEAIVVSLIVRGLLVISGSITGWFVSKDAPNFTFVQGILTLAVIALVVAAIAFWPTAWSRWLDRKKQPD
jgi:O-antigen/teichoic acid export membrane protein